ncbi:MAG: PHP domain-containing protein [Actinobacteria bacterium]|nr:PHP domain-containing protein [Actinomycetota bacterium]
MTGAELHAHTTASDGSFSPLEAVDYALGLGLEALAITDHDTMAGVIEAETQADGRPIEILPGVEISCEHEGAPVHLLGYWADLGVGRLATELANIRESRRTRVPIMVERLQALGHNVSVERVMHFAKGGNPGRPHVAEVLVEAGVIRTISDAFTPDLIGTGGLAYAPKYALRPDTAVEMVRESGGVPVLAHPGLFRGAKPFPKALVESMVDAGLAGIEADHIDHTEEQRTAFTEMASDLGLIATAGSDCHGTLYDPVRMGTCRASMEVVKALKQKQASSS